MGERRCMAPKPRPHGQASRDRELDAWLEHALGTTRPDIEPVLHDL